MGIQIIDADMPLEVESIFMAIYGIPGIGKTSLAFTAKNPLLEDYDGGLQRAVKRKRAVKVDSWEDAVEFHNSGQLEELKIKTLIIDTVGTMLDNYVSQAVIRADAKNAKRDGSLALGGYGAMKTVFNAFVNQMKLKKIDVIFIAHDTNVEEGGYSKKTMKVTGGSYDIIKSTADLIGYITIENEKRVIDFNPTDNYHGKNSAEFDKMIIPHYSTPEYDTFMTDLIQQCKDKMNSLSVEMVEAQQKVDEYKEFINNCNTLDELEMLTDNIEHSLSQTYKVQVDKVYDDKFIVLFTAWVDKTETTEQMDKVVNYASNQRKTLLNPMRKVVNAKMEVLSFSFDKETKKVFEVKKDKDKKESESKDNAATDDKKATAKDKKNAEQKSMEL